MNYEKYKEILKGRLKEKRYIHSLAVADEAVRLAKKYGCDEEKAYLAGLLHDITKNTPKEEQL
ncbi:MAG: HD domain-containing protein, partial [Clostridia bacterium]|nr:HD domain-containing protein [Clostridia bacterium]